MAYVSPFWSYRPAGDLYVFTNWLTRRKGSAPASLLDVLERIYQGNGGSVSTSEANASLIDLKVIFESAQHADNYFAAMERKWEVTLPTVEQIELTNRCPYTCKMCPRTDQMDRSLGDMDIALFESIIRQISPNQQYVALHHFGESLVYPKLVRAIEIAREHGVETGLSCNPPSLPPKLSERLLQAGISNILLSLDSLDAKTYSEIRGSAARLELADRNLRELVRMRNAGNYGTGITLQMINMRTNRDEADRFLAYCRETGVDRGVVVRLGRWDFDDNKLKLLGAFSTPGFSGYCSRPWKSVTVLWDGRVVPCCHDYNGHTILGDLRGQALNELWNSQVAQEFRYRNSQAPLCQRCAFSRSWREKQRLQEGFRQFHRERDLEGARQDWLNPALDARRDKRRLFDEFDILPLNGAEA